MVRLRAAICCSVIWMPVGYWASSRWLTTERPVWVVVVAMQLRMVWNESRGCPAQFLLISLKRRCSMGLYLEQPAG